MSQPATIYPFHPARRSGELSPPEQASLENVILRLEGALDDIDALGAGLAGNHVSHALEMLKAYQAA
ncbi:MAG: hypothetical protein RIS94_3000 [Pseudomonadota bacterium]|jgi:hypothetical protein